MLLAIGVPGYRRYRATERLNDIVHNLWLIDAATEQCCMEASQASGWQVERMNLDGSAGTPAFIAWPAGPVSGEYRPGVCGGRAATFSGGSKGEMTLTQWSGLCRSNPTSCGL